MVPRASLVNAIECEMWRARQIWDMNTKKVELEVRRRDFI